MCSSTSIEPTALLKEEGVTLTLAAVVLSVLAVASNGLLIYVVVRTTALHTPTNFFIASLSTGEALTGMFVVPLAGTSATWDGWALSASLCRFVGVLGVLGPCASALSLLVVSLDRCLAVSKPLRYASLATNKSVTGVIALVWVLSLLASVLPLGGWGEYSYSACFRTCVMSSSPGSLRGHVPRVVLVKEILCVFIPVGLILPIILKTLHHVRGHRRVFVLVPVPVTATSLPTGSRSRASRVKAAQTLLLVSLVYVTSCLPVAVVVVVCQPTSPCAVSARSMTALLWLSFLSCVINPITIMTLNRKFRARLKALLCGGRCGLLQSGPADQNRLFTITSGLHAVLEASLLLNVMHGAGRHKATLRRHAIMSMQARAAEEPGPVYVGRLGRLRTLRKTRSSPDCRTQVAGGSES